MRGETTDPSDLARVQTDKAAFLLRCEKLNGLMEEMGKQAVAVTQAANDCVFDETTTPIQRTVQHKPGRMMSAVNPVYSWISALTLLNRVCPLDG